MNKKVATTVGVVLLILGAVEIIIDVSTSSRGGLLAAAMLMLAGSSLLRARGDVSVSKKGRMAAIMAILLLVAVAVFLWLRR